jgi:hypothetical protein
LLSGSHVSGGSVAICGQIERVHPRCKRLQFSIRKRKRRHPAERSIFDEIPNLTLVEAAQVAVVDERRGTIPALSTLAMTALTETLKLLLC